MPPVTNRNIVDEGLRQHLRRGLLANVILRILRVR